MDFAIPERTRQIVEHVRGIVRHEVMPLESELGGSFAAIEPRLRAVRDKVRAAGLLTPQMPREAGGGGLSLLEHALVSEELGRTPLGHYAFNCQAPDAGNMEVLWQQGTPAQKERFLGPLVRGEIRSCFAMTEPDRPGSNPTWMDTRAVLEGGERASERRKWFTSGADGATFAIVMAVTNPEAAPHMRASQILVPCDTPGFRRGRNIPVMGHAGDGWASHSETRLEGCRVPQANLLGERRLGFAIAPERLGPDLTHPCMRWIGICERSFEMLCKRAAERELSPGKPLGTRQIVQ